MAPIIRRTGEQPRRIGLFLVGAAGIALLQIVCFVRLPGPSSLRDRYAIAINSNVVNERNVTDAVSAVNFDYRGFDTVGEEFILFVSVMGTMVLLRQAEEKRDEPLPDAASPGRDVAPTDALKLWLFIMIAPKVLFGLYIVIHGQLTPGGGFQGGVILASAAMIIYLAENFDVFKRIMTHPVFEIAEAAGAAGFVLVGGIALVVHREFLANVLPLGKANELTCGGTIPLISFATGVEVTGGFLLIIFAFLQETLTASGD